jgi:segregation and condensation protein A
MYKIVLPNFEGPFDLLLYFIKRDELNIYDIPISKITSEFLNYIKLMTLFDIELAGEFVLMAANLIYIKTQMLLPRQKNEDGTFDEDPRKQLVQNILEYMQFKESAKELSIQANINKFAFCRENFTAEFAQMNMNVAFKNATLYDLLKAFGTALNRTTSKQDVHIIEMFNVTVEEKLEEIQTKLLKIKRFLFSEFVQNQSRQHIIVSFLAILELIKAGKIFISQEDNFSEIIISEMPKNEVFA